MPVPKPPLNAVSSRIIDSDVILQRGPDTPYQVYTFGEGWKTFWSNRQGDGIYGKPTHVSGGEIIHDPDPDLISTISPPPAPANIGT